MDTPPTENLTSVSLKLWHSSSRKFERPTIAKLRKHRKNHLNGLLGLWVATTPTWCKGFGKYLYQVTFQGNVKQITVSEFAQLSREHRPMAYVRLRNSLVASGVDCISIIESRGDFEMAVILNMKAIKGFDLQPVETRKDQRELFR